MNALTIANAILAQSNEDMLALKLHQLTFIVYSVSLQSGAKLFDDEIIATGYGAQIDSLTREFGQLPFPIDKSKVKKPRVGIKTRSVIREVVRKYANVTGMHLASEVMRLTLWHEAYRTNKVINDEDILEEFDIGLIDDKRSKPTIYLDMDGTIADTYSIDGWLDRINNLDHTLFTEARPADRDAVFSLLSKLDGPVTILTMLPEHNLIGAEKEVYDSKVRQAKIAWLAEHFPEFTRIEFVEYGDKKSSFYKDGDILIDDSTTQLRHWPGMAIKANWVLALEDSLSKLGLLNE